MYFRFISQFIEFSRTFWKNTKQISENIKKSGKNLRKLQKVKKYINVFQKFSEILMIFSDLRSFDYNKYHTFDDYQKWQDDFVAENSDIAQKISYGKSFENRDLNLIKIGKGRVSYF